MRPRAVIDLICREIQSALALIDDEEIETVTDYILNNKGRKFFVMGVGRVMLMLQAFAKRLNHVGIACYVVGETTIPSIGAQDILIAGSGSGETSTTINTAKLAKKAGAEVLLITATDDSSLRKLARYSLKIPSPTKLHSPGEPTSSQPMTNLFEQCLLVALDAISILLQQRLNVTESVMWQRHSNLE